MRIERRRRLTAAEVAQVRAVVDAATDADGVRPLSEHVMLHLRYGGDEPAHNIVAVDGADRAARIVGYLHLDVTDPVEGPSAELAVDPAARGRGVGRALVEAAVGQGDGRLRLWAHGQETPGSRLAASLGFVRSRVLWQMRRSLYSPLPRPVLPADVTVRTFRVDEDEQAWLEVNNRAFADHPDQGGWTVEDVRNREREPWFDPDGFFLAERGGRVVGFHWTKVHGEDPAGDRAAGHQHEPIGEVYVVGVDPAAQGLGLGPALTLVGLRHLRARGLPAAMLYVDETNAAAIKVYERLGFTRWDVDVCFRRP